MAATRARAEGPVIAARQRIVEKALADVLASIDLEKSRLEGINGLVAKAKSETTAELGRILLDLFPNAELVTLASEEELISSIPVLIERVRAFLEGA